MAMYLCDDNHEEIVHEGSVCPVCELVNRINALENEIYDLENTIKELESEIQTLQREG